MTFLFTHFVFMRCHVLNSRRARSISLAAMCECNNVAVCACVRACQKERTIDAKREPHARERVSNFDIELDISKRSFVVVLRARPCVCVRAIARQFTTVLMCAPASVHAYEMPSQASSMKLNIHEQPHIGTYSVHTHTLSPTVFALTLWIALP